MRDLLLHIGTAKTGTTTLQHFLAENQAMLDSAGVRFPIAADPAHKHGLLLTAAIRPPAFWPREFKLGPGDDPAPIQAAAERFVADVRADDSGALTVLSSEHLAGLRSAKIDELLDRCGAASTTVVCYVREPTHYWMSAVAQRLKGSSRLPQPFRFPGRYNVAEQLRRWEEIVGRDRLVVRPFDRPQLSGGNVCTDFLRVLSQQRAPVADLALETPADRNPAPSAEEIIGLQELREEWLEQRGFSPESRRLEASIRTHARDLPTTPARAAFEIQRTIRDHYAEDFFWLRDAYAISFDDPIGGVNQPAETERAEAAVAGGRVRDIFESFDPAVCTELRTRVGRELGYLQ